MRLLDVATLELKKFRAGQCPPYAILSHTWSMGEVRIDDLRNKEAQKKAQYPKLAACCKETLRAGLEYLWVDTCCIDKTRSSEVSESISSMYQWYREAAVCFAYLSDFEETGPIAGDVDSLLLQLQLSRCRWFHRGWTLIELIAPPNVLFFDKHWQPLGDKKSPKLSNLISNITSISPDVLKGERAPTAATVGERISWLGDRQTTRLEDMAYCLMGLFEVRFPVLYGEGTTAILRLWEAILKNLEDYTILLWTKPATRSGSQPPQAGNRSIVPGSEFYARENPGCPDWPKVTLHSPVALGSAIRSFLPSFEKPPEGPQLTARGLKTSLFAKKVRSDIIAWTYCTQQKDNGNTYALCAKVMPTDELENQRQYLRGTLTGEVCYVLVNRLEGFRLHDIYFSMEQID